MTASKPPGKQWAKGTSGNPKGRTPGQSPITKLREAIGKRAPEVLERMIELAMDGDVQAGKLILERYLPSLKPSELAQSIPMPDGTLTEQAKSVLAAVAAGKLAPGTGTALLSAIAGLARVAEVDELTKRVEALEVQHGGT
ncbi:DUF5681 domain-containing protein [Propionivibrio sp.]|uniref:DUF5681 domain-containing protein n=1 Tax=Propionivibrio sp. TaxID=2212460 RepID=UPI003BF012D0